MTDSPTPAWRPAATAPTLRGRHRCDLCGGGLNADAARYDAARYTVYRGCAAPDCNIHIYAVVLCDPCAGGPLPAACPHCSADRVGGAVEPDLPDLEGRDP